MKPEETHKDILQELFKDKPLESPSPDFTQNLINRITSESSPETLNEKLLFSANFRLIAVVLLALLIAAVFFIDFSIIDLSSFSYNGDNILDTINFWESFVVKFFSYFSFLTTSNIGFAIIISIAGLVFLDFILKRMSQFRKQAHLL